jgi:hypothetical protein
MFISFRQLDTKVLGSWPGMSCRASRSLRIAISAFLLFSVTLFGQNPTAIASPSEITDTLNIAFLHQIQRYAAADTQTRARYAQRLGVTQSELPGLFDATREFASAEQSLMAEARAYRQRQNSLNQPLSLDRVKDFTARRYTLARTTVASLQNRLPAASYSALQHFLTTEFPKSVSFWK